MNRPRVVLVLLVLATMGTLAAGAHGTVSAGRPAGSPDLAAMALAVSDLPRGARISLQRYYRDPDYVASYEREFEIPGTRLGRSRLVGTFESLDVERTPAAAASTFALVAVLFRGEAGARLVEALLVEEGIPASSIKVGRIRQPKIGHGAVVIPIQYREQGMRLELVLTLFRYDRVLGSIGLVAVPGRKLYLADAYKLTRVAVTRTRAGLVPANAVPPTVTGTLQPGQVLTAARGTWTGDQLTYSYQWERCFSTGLGCVPLPGATSTTYTVATGDLDSSLRVTVTGRNRLGAASSSSAVGAVVTGPAGSPVVTAPPDILSGTLTVGATVTATPGSWTGEPTAYTYQWRRCDAAGACPDVVGATQSTYVISAADSRSSLRVFVVATNAAGSGGSISPPTAVIP